MSDLAVRPDRAALLVIDVQERLAMAMADDVRDRVERNLITLAAAAERFGLPVVVSEQYPKGLGRTTPAVAQALETVKGVCFFEKVEFAATAAPAWREAVGDSPRPLWLVSGMETHVCVYQTVRALCAAGQAVQVIADAVASRTEANWKNGLELCARAGAVITNTETVVFDLLGKAGTEDFRALSKMIK
ncbi:MAG TPA: isochorismatase family protein [Kofleriaceae bacterium]|jgi:nicotinamidase-related amidase|nr:isochorismatase family protein [Kofleriaceae bacterium]